MLHFVNFSIAKKRETTISSVIYSFSNYIIIIAKQTYHLTDYFYTCLPFEWQLFVLFNLLITNWVCTGTAIWPECSNTTWLLPSCWKSYMVMHLPLIHRVLRPTARVLSISNICRCTASCKTLRAATVKNPELAPAQLSLTTADRLTTTNILGLLDNF